MKKILVILFFILILPFIINIPDESLTKDAQTLINDIPHSQKPMTDNGFYALIGFEAAVGKDIYEAGKQAYTAYARSQDNVPPDYEFSIETVIGPRPELPEPNLIPRCKPEKHDCLDFYFQKEETLLYLMLQNALLLERYESLNKFTFFQNDFKPTPWTPLIRLEKAILSGHLLTVGKASVLFNKNNYKEAFELLLTDIALWRKLLTGASDLPGKIYSSLALRMNYSLLEEMLDKLPSGETYMTMNRDVIAPLTTEEISTDLIWDRRFRELAWSLSNNLWPYEYEQEANMSFLERWFCKSNATLNDAYDMFYLLKQLSTVEPDKIEDVRKIFSQHLAKTAKLNLQKIYNPLGKNFVSVSFDDRAGTNWNKDIRSLDELIGRIRDKVEE